VFVHGAERYLPLYEAKMVHHYDHRWATYVSDDETSDVSLVQKQDPQQSVLPRYWVPVGDVQSQLERSGWQQHWLLGWRDISNVTNERTLIAGVIPFSGVGNQFQLAFNSVALQLLLFFKQQFIEL
jgi:hypothetical protein